MYSEYQTLAEEILDRANGKHVVYIPNPGNWGDGFIRYGTKLFFEDFKIPHIEVNIAFPLGKISLTPFILPSSNKKRLIIYGGGGAWCKAYSIGMETVTFISRFTKHFVVLPSTYEIPVRGFKGSFYRRGLSESASACRPSKFCHDMALYTATKPQEIFIRPENKQKIGLFLRNDLESAIPQAMRASLPPGRDLSIEGDHMSCGDSFFRKVAKYESIFTDRLHVAIAGAIAGSEVHLLAGNYFKIREIYDASLHGRFDNRVRLLDRETFISLALNCLSA